MSAFEYNPFAWPVLTVLFIVGYGLFLRYVILLFFGDYQEPVVPTRSTVWERALRSVWAPLVLTLLFGYLSYAVFVGTLPIHRSFGFVAMFFAVSMCYFAYRVSHRKRGG